MTTYKNINYIYNTYKIIKYAQHPSNVTSAPDLQLQPWRYTVEPKFS